MSTSVTWVMGEYEGKGTLSEELWFCVACVLY